MTRRAVSQLTLRIHAAVLAVALAVIGGVTLSAMTAWLLIKGGTNVVRVVREEREDPDDEVFFLHGCKFISENDGYRCTVLVLNILLAMIRQKEPQQA